MIIKKEYGGLEFSARMLRLAYCKLSGVSGILAITVGVPNSLGPGELLQHYGTEEQSEEYRVWHAVRRSHVSLTSPEAGSDAGDPDTGVVCMGDWQGPAGAGMRLTWNNVISRWRLSLPYCLAFKTLRPENCWWEDLGITCALTSTSTPGVQIAVATSA